jgi:SAM-dependent methyltransferase
MAAAPPNKVEKNGRTANATTNICALHHSSLPSPHPLPEGEGYPEGVIRNGSGASGALVQAAHPWGDAQLAQLYDAFAFDGDLPLYLDLARAQGGRVLEVGCGTGRVLLPLVRAGHEVTGVDISPHMLAVVQSKLDAEPGIPGRAHLVRADMRDFHLDDAPFDLATVAVKSFAYLLERQDQLSCVRTIVEHLRPGGVLAMDFLHPKPQWVGEPVGRMRDDLIATDAVGVTVSRLESVVSVDLARQVRTIRSAYEVIDANGAVVQKRFVEWPYRWTHRFEAEHLLERAGLEIEALYGGYAGEPFTSDSPAMLFVARKPTTRRP